MYHDPCHTPMKTYAPLDVVNELMGAAVALNDRCCGESGSLATTRPDISTQVRFRKEEEMRKGAAALRGDGFDGEVKVLTSCPSCLQGLSRFDDDAGTHADYIVVEMAKRILGPGLAAALRRPRECRRDRARAGLSRADEKTPRGDEPLGAGHAARGGGNVCSTRIASGAGAGRRVEIFVPPPMPKIHVSRPTEAVRAGLRGRA